MGHPEPFDLKYVAVGNEDCGKKNYQGNLQIYSYCWSFNYSILCTLLFVPFCFDEQQITSSSTAQ